MASTFSTLSATLRGPGSRRAPGYVAEHRDRLVEAVLAPPLVQGHRGAAGARFERADAVADRHRQRRERVGVERIELGDRGVEVIEAELTGAGAGLAYVRAGRG